MNTLLTPVGPEPAEVYWRRRVAVLLVFATVLMAAVAATIAWRASGRVDTAEAKEPTATQAMSTATPDALATPSATTEPSDSASETPTASASPSVPGSKDGQNACSADQIEITATVGKDRYAPGKAADIGIQLVNTSTAVCEMDTGTAALELIIRDADDVVWSSDHCQLTSRSKTTRMSPGEAVTSEMKWYLNTTSADCESRPVAASAGTYTLTARAGDLYSEAVSFTVG